jgi:aromatic ring-opening dioxygenase LigB subunit
MALVKTSILPHSPLLIPEIGRANHSFLKQTVSSYNKIKEDLKVGIDTLIVITPHGENNGSFNINAAPEAEINFQDFGFIPPKTIFKGDLLLADKIKNELRENFPVNLSSDNILDYGSAVPVYLLQDSNLNFKLITITPPEDSDLETCYTFGKELKKIINESDKKIAIISSSDLSHRLKKKSPGGYSPKGAKFDNKLLEYLSEPMTASDNILKMDRKMITDAGECGLRPILILLGILDGNELESKVLSYQTDFGVGYLSLDFKLIASAYVKGE